MADFYYLARTMASTDITFADRLGRADTLSSAITLASPAFDPADASLGVANFAAFVSGLQTVNDDTNAANDIYSTAVITRMALVKDVKARALRAMRYVQSNPAWSSNAGSLKLPYNKLVDNRPKRPKLPVGGTPGEVKKAIKTGEQSFSDMASLFAKFVGGLSRVAGYVPPAPELLLAELQTLSSSFTTMNQSMAGLAETAATQVRTRQAGFADLKTKAAAIKKGVAAQYGLNSPVYTSIRGLAF